MRKFVVQGKKKVWFVQRSYAYEQQTTHETEDQWRARVSEEWSLDELRKKTVAVIRATYIFHNADFEADGNKKGLHVHGVFEFKDHSGITQDAAIQLFGLSGVEHCQHPASKAGAYQYLTHVTQAAIADGKTRYPPADLHIDLMPDEAALYSKTTRGITEFYYYACSKIKVKRLEESKKDAQKSALDTYITAVSRGQITAAAAYDAIEQDEALADFTASDAQRLEPSMRQAEATFARRLKDYCATNPMCKTVIYMQGRGGTGKSTLCRAFAAAHDADGRGYHSVAPKGKDTSFDLADGYNMEITTIANEVSGAAFRASQFLDVMDPRSATKANSRNMDKFYAPSYVLLNNSIPLEKFISDMCFWPAWRSVEREPQALNCHGLADMEAYVNSRGGAFADKALQVRRRVAILVQLQTNRVDVYIRDDGNNRPAFYAYNIPDVYPYQFFDCVNWNPDDPATVSAAVDLIDRAVSAYYDLNGYSVTPLNAGRAQAMAAIGDVVDLPGSAVNDLGITVTPGRTITWQDKTYTPDDFNKLLDLWVGTLEKYTIGDKMPIAGRIVEQTYKYVGDVNKIFWADAVQRVCYPSIFSRFMDVRAARRDAGTWPVWQGKTKK